MAEIACKHCSSTDCHGCNLLRLEQMLKTGKLDALMNGNHAIQTAADVVEVVRCADCKYRIVNEHFGEPGYMKLKAMCKMDTGDPFELGRNAEDDDWFCADGERKDGDGE